MLLGQRRDRPCYRSMIWKALKGVEQLRRSRVGRCRVKVARRRIAVEWGVKDTLSIWDGGEMDAPKTPVHTLI